MLTQELIDLGNQYLPWPESGLELRKPEGPSPGLRLSNDCGACRILDFFLQRENNYVSDGVSLAGHMLADLFIQALLPEHVEVEREFEWLPKKKDGECDAKSGMDALILKDDSPYRAHYEFKTSSKENPKPLAYNRRQVIRQRVVMAREFKCSDTELPPSVIYIIEKAGKTTNYIRGPFHIEPTAEELAHAWKDIDLTTAIYMDIVEDGVHPEDHPLLKQIQGKGCYDCFPRPVGEASAELKALIDGEYKKNIVQYEKYSKWYKEFREEKVRPLIDKGTDLETDKFVVKHTASGTLKIDARRPKKAGGR